MAFTNDSGGGGGKLMVSSPAPGMPAGYGQSLAVQSGQVPPLALPGPSSSTPNISTPGSSVSVSDFNTAQGTADYNAYLQSDAAKAAGITPEYVAALNSNTPANVQDLTSQQIIVQTLQNIAANPGMKPADVARANAVLSSMPPSVVSAASATGASGPVMPITSPSSSISPPSAASMAIKTMYDVTFKGDSTQRLTQQEYDKVKNSGYMEGATVVIVEPPPLPSTTPVDTIPAGFKATGNVPNDILALKAAGATLAQVASYMAQYVNGYNPGWETEGNPTEKAAVAYLKSMGYDPTAPTYTFTIQDDPNKAPIELHMQADVYDKMTPAEQFSYLQSIGQVPADAKLIVSNSGTWSYSIPIKTLSNVAPLPVVNAKAGVVTFNTSSGPITVSIAQWTVMTGQQRFDFEVSKGIIPAGATFVAGDDGQVHYSMPFEPGKPLPTDTSSPVVNTQNAKINAITESGAFTQEQLAILKVSDPGLYNILITQGIGAYNTWVSTTNLLQRRALDTVGVTPKMTADQITVQIDTYVTKNVDNDLLLKSTLAPLGYSVAQIQSMRTSVQALNQLRAGNFIDSNGYLKLTEAVAAGIPLSTLHDAGFAGISDSDYSSTSNALKSFTAAEQSKQAALQLLQDQGYRVTAGEIMSPELARKNPLRAGMYTDQYKLYQFLMDAKLKDAAIPVMTTPGATTTPIDTNLQQALQTLRTAGFSDATILSVKVQVDTYYEHPEFIGQTIKPGSGPPTGLARGANTVENNIQNWLADLVASSQPDVIVAPTVVGGKYTYFQNNKAQQIASGAVLAAVSAATSIPLLITQVVKNPLNVPKIAVDTIKGMASSLSDNVYKLATNGYKTSYDMAFNTTTSIIILSSLIEPLKGAIGKYTCYIDDAGIPPGAIAKELSTARLALKENLDVVMRNAITETLKQMSSKDTPFTGEVPIAGTSLKFRYLKSPMQQICGNLQFHGLTDGFDFIKEQAEIVVSDGSTTVKLKIPLASDITRSVLKLETYSNDAIAALDTPQIRALNLADAADLPKEMARVVQDYIKANNGKIYGSFVDWIKNKVAARPNDIDVVFKDLQTADAAKNFVSQEAAKLGFKTLIDDRGVSVLKDGKWTTIANIVDEASHADMMKAGKFVEHTTVTAEGVTTTTTGTQLVNQALGSLEGSAKSAIRAGKVVTEAPGIVRIAEASNILPSGTVVIRAGESGLYTDPLAALAYTRGDILITAENIAKFKADFPAIKIGDAVPGRPGILMRITDDIGTADIKTSTVTKFSQSDKFIATAEEGVYGPFKTWRGDFESELVLSPKTPTEIPLGDAPLNARILAGEWADFFTYDDGKFVPIKIGLDPAAVARGTLHMPTELELYATKLMTVENAIRDTTEALKHPIAMAQDMVRIVKAFADPEAMLLGRSGVGNTTFPGVRDIYLMTDWGVKIRGIVKDLFNRTKEVTENKAIIENIKADSKRYAQLYEESMRDVYAASARGLLNDAVTLAAMYQANPAAKRVFETSYMTNLTAAMTSLFKSQSVTVSSLNDSLHDVSRNVIDARAGLNDVKISPSSTPMSSTLRNLSSLSDRVATISSEAARSASSEVSSSTRRASETRSPITESRSVEESRSPSVESRVAESRRPAEERRLEEERRLVEERRPVEERRLAEERRLTEERRPAEERRLTEERRPPEDRRPPNEIRPPTTYKGSSKQQATEALKEAFKGSIGWKQGVVIWAGKYPFKTLEDWHAFSIQNPPEDMVVVQGGPGSAYQSIQAMYPELVPTKLVLKLGFQDVTIAAPEKEPGKPGAIGFHNVSDGDSSADLVLKYHERGGKMLEDTEQGKIVVSTATPGRVLGPAVQRNWPALKYGSDFYEAIRYQPKDAAQQAFIEKKIGEQVSNLNSAQVAAQLQEAGYGPTDDMTLLVMRHMPDSARSQLLFMLENPDQYAVGPDMSLIKLKPGFSPTQADLEKEANMEAAMLKTNRGQVKKNPIPPGARNNVEKAVRKGVSQAVTAIMGPEVVNSL